MKNSYILNSIEYISNRTRKYSRYFLWPKHRVCFSWSCLTIHKNCPIIALKCGLSYWTYDRAINLRSFAFRSKYIIKLEWLRLYSVLVSPSQLLLSDKCININLTVWTCLLQSHLLLYLIHDHGDWIPSERVLQTLIKRIDSILSQVNTPNFFVFVGGEQGTHTDTNFNFLRCDFTMHVIVMWFCAIHIYENDRRYI